MDCTKYWIKQGRLLFLTAALVTAPAGYAQEASGVSESRPEAVQSAENGQLRFEIPPQALASALSSFGEAADLQVLYDAALARGLKTEGVSGTYTPEQALRILLAGTGLVARFGDSGTVTLERLAVGKGKVLPGVVVTATRGLGKLADSPQAVTVVSREQIEKQAALSSDLGDLLAKTVPGMATSNEGLSDAGQTLRGRDLFVLIDGVPQTIQLRDGLRNLKTIDPSSIERIEVLRGSTGVYGLGGTGGVINIITRKPGEGPTRFTTEVTLGFAPADVGESLRKRLAQRAEGGGEKVDYVFSVSGEQTGGSFDGEGDRIPTDANVRGGDFNAYDLFGKLGFDLDAQQRLEVSANYYDVDQGTDFVLVPGVAGEQKATALEGKDPGENQGITNKQINLAYRHDDVLGSRVKAQLYYRDYRTRFRYSATAFPGGGQTSVDSQRTGARLDIESPLSSGRLLWGVDLLSEETAQPLEDGRLYVPKMRQDTLGPFVQAEFDVTDKLLLHGGARYETIRFDVNNFTTVRGNNSVEGGELNYNDTVLNLGAVYNVTDEISGFASFSQGFTVPEIGRTLRNAPDGTSIKNIRPEPQVVDNYELGIRGNWSMVQTSLSMFYSTSDMGASLTSPGSPTDPILVLRDPERIYGVEATLDAQPLEKWEVGGTLTWMEGKRDADNNGSYETYLLGNRIPPLKLTAYTEDQTSANWRNRLQLLYSGDRNRFGGESGFGKGEVRDFVLVDLLSTVKLSKGSLKVGVENLFDTQYFPVVSQYYNFDNQYTAGQGRIVSATYSREW